VVAADGGASWLAEVGVEPHRLIGDLDSIEPALAAGLAEVGIPVDRHPADKDASDLELSLEAATGAGAEEIVILGGLGGAVDHELANVLLLLRSAPDGPSVRLVHGGTTIRMLRGPGRTPLDSSVGSRVSLLPLGPAEGITTHGLHWPLSDARLDAGTSRGLANRVDATPAWVAVSSGRLLVIEIAPPEGSV
jgi:thiamine pyrophosphokinase